MLALRISLNVWKYERPKGDRNFVFSGNAINAKESDFFLGCWQCLYQVKWKQNSVTEEERMLWNEFSRNIKSHTFYNIVHSEDLLYVPTLYTILSIIAEASKECYHGIHPMCLAERFQDLLSKVEYFNFLHSPKWRFQRYNSVTRLLEKRGSRKKLLIDSVWPHWVTGFLST